MGIPLAHYKSESYQDANIANNRKIIGNVRTIFGKHKGIVRGRCIRPVGIKRICNLLLAVPAYLAGVVLRDLNFVV